MKDLPIGLYDLLHTKQLHSRLEKAGLLDQAKWGSIAPEEIYTRLAIPLSREIVKFIREAVSGSHKDLWITALENILQNPQELIKIVQTVLPVGAEILQQITPPAPYPAKTTRPDTPLSESALLTGSSRTPSLRSQLIKELATCDRADWLVSFIKFAGILPLLPTLREFTQTPAADGDPRLRIATTSYMGATDVKAVKFLLELPNTEIRVSYDTKRTRLHAKAYLFHRDTGFSSAYIGSANVSKAALDEGLEWTAKVSQYETDHLWQHAIATFESHWEDQTEFTPCTKENLTELEKALSRERRADQSDNTVSFFDLRPFGFQQIILDDIAAEREAGKHTHLIIAATGTGKTMVAAFDYRSVCSSGGKRPTLLFVAHREELLKQAQAAFRQVLRDGSFGDIVASGHVPAQIDYIFCTVQSWNSRDFDQLPADFYEYIVLDEAHHGKASSYQKLIQHINPNSLLGLTATPERSDGSDIRDDFGGAFTHEMRLPEAVERALLAPFHYYGIPDLDGLDFSALSWKRGGYDITQIQELLDSNEQRAQWVLGQTDKYVADLKKVRGLGFCVSIKHAEFMADYFNTRTIAAAALSGESSKDKRRSIQEQLRRHEIQFIFTVDLYNEGVDIPSVDTVLFLRPTESLTLFLQQLGRGLRLHPEKSQLTVLDFIAPQHRHFNFVSRFRALCSRPGLRMDTQIEAGMPFVPTGCFIHLEKQAKEHVLANIRAATAAFRGERLLRELKTIPNLKTQNITLQNILDHFHLDSPDELYKRGLPHQLLAKARGITAAEHQPESKFSMTEGFRRMLLMDDTLFLDDAKRLVESGENLQEETKSLMHSVLWGGNRPSDGSLNAVHEYLLSHRGFLHDLVELFDWISAHKPPVNRKRFDQSGVLNLHNSYTREQVLLALGKGTFENTYQSREGVLHISEKRLDVFFADINKSESDFSPTTMYEDYAITDRLFHWQSQSQTSESSPVGQRYINHEQTGYTPLLFVRERKKTANGLTSPYFFAGPLRYKRHEGSKPISFIWELAHPLPAKAFAWTRRVG